MNKYFCVGLSYLPYWKTLWGNKINGTNGSWFPPLINKDLQSERLYLYSTDICRSVYAKFEQHSSILKIPTELFSIPSEIFLNSTLNPDNIAFGTYDSGVLDVGLVLSAQKRLQINVFLQPEPLIDDLKRISEVILPAIWINESTTIDQKSANDLNNQVLRYFTIIHWVSIVLISVGIVIFIITIAFFAKRRSQKNTFTPIVNPRSANSVTSDNDY
ncbi:unnamed protein product [Rotaria sp. Silwood2]|nr:unnamed protein product [Rotaria sp. Silwood2]